MAMVSPVAKSNASTTWGSHRHTDACPRGEWLSIQYARRQKLQAVSTANVTCSWFNNGQGTPG
jgi:hypothetical protein